MRDEINKLIKKYGVCIRQPQGKDKGEYHTICQGCGRVINTADPDSKPVEYVKTKRGDTYFIHCECANKVWNSKIRWIHE